MSLANSDVMRTYRTTPVRPTRKMDLMIISEMKSSKILMYLAYRHRVGLLGFAVAVLIAYLAYDKFLHLFF